MSKDQAAASLSPTLMILGAPIYAEHLRATIKQANWTFGNRPQIHLNQSTGKRTATGSTSAETTPTTLGLEFRGTAAGKIEVLRFHVNILPETVNVICGAEVYIPGGGASVRFTIGAASQTITYLTADSGTEKTATITTASSGTGWQICTVDIEKTSGAFDMQLSRVRVQDESITSALPSPTIEGDSETMDIQEEGSAVVISARKLNFIGADITAASAGSGTANVTVTAMTYQNKTASFSAAVDYFYTVDSSSGDVTATLPAVATSAAKTVDVCHKVIGNNLIFDGNGSETINGALTLTVAGTAYENTTLFCTGSEWLLR